MTIPLAGVLGSPIKHSKSPLIHNTWLKDLNLKGLYVPLDVKAEDLSRFMDLAPRLGFVGFNVTIPHKEAVAQYCSTMTETARRAGSVNTIWFDEQGQAQGDSTDGYGFIQNLAHKAEWTPSGRRVAMFGAGGASRAVAAALIDGGVSELRLANRTQARAEELAKHLGSNVKCVDWDNVTGDAGMAGFLEGVDLVVNATSLGMAGGPDWRWRLPPFPSEVIATDLIYAPLQTPFLIAAAKQGAQTVDGLGMLLHQAAPGFERWFGRRPNVTDQLRKVVLEKEGALP